MIRLILTTLLLVVAIACSKDKPAPIGPASKAISDAVPIPTGLRVEDITPTSARLVWNAVEDATDYNVFYKELVGTWALAKHQGIETHSDLDGLQPDTNYGWAVNAERGDEISGWAYGSAFTTAIGEVAVDSLLVSEFHIELRFADNVPLEWRPIFQQAAMRWEEVIIGDVEDVYLPDRYSSNDLLVSGELIDDIIITVENDDAIIGSAVGGIGFLRPGTTLPATGEVIIDGNYMLSYWREVGEVRDSYGQMEDIEDFVQVRFRHWLYETAVHEIGHALGIGTAWLNDARFHRDQDPMKSYFAGEHAVAAFRASKGATFEGNAVPVYGTSHWNGRYLGEATMDNHGIEGERISTITVGALADLGYEVDFTQGHVCTVFREEDQIFSSAWDRVTNMAKLFMYEQFPDLRRVDGPYYTNFIKGMIGKGHLEDGYDGIFHPRSDPSTSIQKTLQKEHKKVGWSHLSSYVLKAITGGTAPFTVRLEGTLPPGFTFTYSGGTYASVGGSPEVGSEGVYDFVLIITDADGVITRFPLQYIVLNADQA